MIVGLTGFFLCCFFIYFFELLLLSPHLMFLPHCLFWFTFAGEGKDMTLFDGVGGGGGGGCIKILKHVAAGVDDSGLCCCCVCVSTR